MQAAVGYDLHTHSTVSDGTQPPAEVVRSAADAALPGLALTDHDSTAGWASAITAARELGIGLIPGVELSSRIGWRSVHLLGYLIDPTNAALVAEMARIQAARLTRAQGIVERLGADYPITWDDVLLQTGEGATVGRPHIADALVALGLAGDRGDAFAGLLHPRNGYIEPHYAPEPAVGVALIRAAGGVPVLAHPGAPREEWALPADVISGLVDAGLFALERDHPENQRGGAARVDALARRFSVAVTGSSDYHGAGKPNRIGQFTTPPDVVERLIAEATGTAAVPAA